MEIRLRGLENYCIKEIFRLEWRYSSRSVFPSGAVRRARIKKKKKIDEIRELPWQPKLEKPRTQRKEKSRKVSQYFCKPLSCQRHLIFLGLSVKDRNPGGNKEGRTFANLMTFFL